MATPSRLLYKTGRSSTGTRHLIFPGGDTALCGAEVEYVFPGIGGKDLDNADYCGNCNSAGKSNETKFAKKPVTPTPPTPPTPPQAGEEVRDR